MLRYETLVLANSHVTKDELSTLENFIDNLTVQFKGKLSLFDNWGKQRLAYSVEKNDYGVFVLIRYEIPQESAKNFFKELESFFKLKFNEVALRYVTIKLNEKKGLEYHRPEPVNSRAGNLDSFIKENKIDKFLNTGSEKKIEKEKPAEAKKVVETEKAEA